MKRVNGRRIRRREVAAPFVLTVAVALAAPACGDSETTPEGTDPTTAVTGTTEVPVDTTIEIVNPPPPTSVTEPSVVETTATTAGESTSSSVVVNPPPPTSSTPNAVYNPPPPAN